MLPKGNRTNKKDPGIPSQRDGTNSDHMQEGRKRRAERVTNGPREPSLPKESSGSRGKEQLPLDQGKQANK